MYDLRVTNNFGINNGDIEEIRKLDNIDKLETYYKKILRTKAYLPSKDHLHLDWLMQTIL